VDLRRIVLRIFSVQEMGTLSDTLKNTSIHSCGFKIEPCVAQLDPNIVSDHKIVKKFGEIFKG